MLRTHAMELGAPHGSFRSSTINRHETNEGWVLPPAWWRSSFAQELVPRAQAKPLHEARRHVDVTIPGQIAVQAASQEASLIRHHLEDARHSVGGFPVVSPFGFGLVLHHRFST
jgi:hypothetical protein